MGRSVACAWDSSLLLGLLLAVAFGVVAAATDVQDGPSGTHTRLSAGSKNERYLGYMHPSCLITLNVLLEKDDFAVVKDDWQDDVEVGRFDFFAVILV